MSEDNRSHKSSPAGEDPKELVKLLTQELSGVQLPAMHARLKHDLKSKRLYIAAGTLIGAATLITICLGLSIYQPWRAEVNLYETIIFNLFGIITLAFGFIAGSSLDRE